MPSAASFWRGDPRHKVIVAIDPAAADGTATIDFQATFGPVDDPAEECWQITQGDSTVASGHFAGSNTPVTQTLQATDQAHDFVLTTWLDKNENGTLDPGEDTRTVNVHVIDLRSDNNGDGVVNATDDALNALYPTALNLEGNGQRTEVEFTIGTPDGSAGGWQAVLPDVPGLEFWTAAEGGRQLAPDANGNIINTSLSGLSGQYTCTLWVSAASASTEDLGMAPMAILAQRAGKPGGVAGDATIQLEIKDQVGRTVAQSNVAVNKPIEVLYAVDGTTDTAADNTVVRQFFTRFQQTKHYYDGPDLAGTKGPEIFRNVENDILSDVAVAESKYHRDVAIDLVGYSRGAVIVATVAKDLLTTHMINGTPQVLSVHWMGLFDPVSMFVGITPRRGLSWATMVPPNVQSCGCAIKQLGVLPTQKNLKGYGEDGSVLGNYGPAGSTKKFWLNHIDLGHNGSSLLDNIRPLDWMIQQAQANKVPVK